MQSNTDNAQSPEAMFAERFVLGVCIGSATVSVFHLETWWAASLAFTAFVLFLLFRWERLVRDPWVDDDHPTES